MKNKKYLVLIITLLLMVLVEPGLTLSQSENALIRKPVFKTPVIWKMTRDVTETYWDVRLFNNPISSSQSYIMSPSYDLFTGVCSKIWNGTDNSGQSVVSGNYRVEIVDSCIYWDITTNTPTNVVTKEEWFYHIESCCNLRGDVAIPKDGSVLANDIVWLVDFLFRGGTAPECWDEGDCAIPLDGNIIVNDIVWLVNYLFKGGTAPPEC